MTTETKQLALWRVAKKLLVREAARGGVPQTTVPPEDLAVHRVLVACLVNETANLPDIGRRVQSIVRRPGEVDIYFDDDSFVSVSVPDLQPWSNEEAAWAERVLGIPATPHSCGCKHAAQTIDMVAAVGNGELLRAMDVGRRDSENPRMWRYLVEGPFDLFHLQGVPMGLATALADFGTRGTRLQNGHQAWLLARHHAEPHPFRRVRT
jgi:hypothetical protein